MCFEYDDLASEYSLKLTYEILDKNLQRKACSFYFKSYIYIYIYTFITIRKVIGAAITHKQDKLFVTSMKKRLRMLQPAFSLKKYMTLKCDLSDTLLTGQTFIL